MRKFAAAAYLLIIGAAVVFFRGKSDIFGQLRLVTPGTLALLFAAVAAHQLFNGLRFRHLLRLFDLVVPFREWFGLTVCNTMFSYYLPAKGGMALRAAYLKRRHGFPYARNASLIAGGYVICLVVSALAGLALVTATGLLAGRWYPVLFGLLALLLAATLAGAGLLALLARRRFRSRFERVNRAVAGFTEGFSYFRADRRALALFVLFHLASVGLLAVRLFIAFRTLGGEITFADALIIQTLTGFTLVLSLTPGNLGIKEGVIAFAAGVMGVPASTALIAAVVDRAAAVIVVFTLGLLYSRTLLRDVVPPPVTEAPGP